MPQFPSQNLNTQKICESYPRLLQIYSSSLVLDGTGSLITFLNLTASYALNSPSTIGTSGTSGLSYGTSGTTGTSGTSGQTGTSGSSGSSGTSGSSGSSGSSGTSGSSGQNGSSGSSGQNGSSGSSGQNGSSGSSGSSGTSGGGASLTTGSLYPITSSWALYTLTSSYIQVTGVSYPVRKINNNYTIVRTTDYTILCDATSGSFDVKLPNPSGNTNIYNIKKIDRTGHCVNVMVTNASYIDYDVTQSICHRGTNMTIQSDGTNQYWIL
jgi:hypothetical protein